jgi:hypothetical protein
MGSEVLAYRDAVAVAKSDTVNDTNGPFAGIYVGDISGGATLVVDVDLGGSVASRTFTNVLAGVIIPIRCVRVHSTGTTAGNLLGMKAAT